MQLQVGTYHIQCPKQQNSISDENDDDDEFHLVKSKSEFVEGDRYKPFEDSQLLSGSLKKKDTRVLSTKEILRYTKQDIVDMYEALLKDKDDQIKFLKDKVAIQDRMLNQIKNQRSQPNSNQIAQGSGGSGSNPSILLVSKSDSKSNTDLKIMPNRELNKVMGIRSPDLTSSKKQFLNTDKLYSQQKYKYSNLRYEGEEDLSEEDVNEEDILQQFPRETQLTNNNGGAQRGIRTHRSNAISYQTYRNSRTQKLARPLNSSLDSPELHNLKQGLAEGGRQNGKQSGGNSKKNEGKSQQANGTSVPFAQVLNENINNSPSKSNSLYDGDSQLRVTTKKNFQVNVPIKGREYSQKKEQPKDEMQRFEETHQQFNNQKLRSYNLNENNKRGSLMNMSSSIYQSQTNMMGMQQDDEINDGIRLSVKDSIVSQSCQTVNERGAGGMGGSKVGNKANGGFSLKGRVRSNTIRLNNTAQGKREQAESGPKGQDQDGNADLQATDSFVSGNFGAGSEANIEHPNSNKTRKGHFMGYPVNSLISGTQQPQENPQIFSNEVQYENTNSNVPTETLLTNGGGGQHFSAREWGNFDQKANKTQHQHTDSLRLNKSVNRGNEQSNMFKYKNGNSAELGPHSDYLETMHSDKAVLGKNAAIAQYIAQSQRHQISNSNLDGGPIGPSAANTMASGRSNQASSIFTSDQKTKIKMSQIAPKHGVDMQAAHGPRGGAGTGGAWEASGDKSEGQRRYAVVSASSHEKLFKKKNFMNKKAGGGASVGSTEEMFRKKTMKRLVDDADILNQSSLSDEIERDNIQVINSSDKQESAFLMRQGSNLANNIIIDMSQIKFGKNTDDTTNREKHLASWFGSPGPEAEFNHNEISEQCVIRVAGQEGAQFAQGQELVVQGGRETQRHLQKFGPSGFTMGLKTPVKKALGEKNTFIKKDNHNSNSNLTQDGSLSLVDGDGENSQITNNVNLMSQESQFLLVEHPKNKIKENTANNKKQGNQVNQMDHNDEFRNERIEMLRKSIGRGNRVNSQQHNLQGSGSSVMNPQNQSSGTSSFLKQGVSEGVVSPLGDDLGQRPSLYDKDNFAMEYYSKNHRLIEDFFVIGLDQNDVFQIEKTLSLKYHPDKNHRQQINMPNTITNQAKLLYIYSGNSDCPRRKVVKDFCFPSMADEQILLQRLKDQSEMNDVLYGQRGLLRHNIFIFNMQADDMSDAHYQHDNVYHCICLINYEIVRIQHPQSIARSQKTGQDAYYEYYKCPKAYVLMSKHPFFSLFVDVLCQIIQIFKLEQLEQSKMLVQQDSSGVSEDLSFSMQMINDVNAAIGMDVMVPQVKCFLDVLSEIDLLQSVTSSNSLRISKQGPKLRIDFNYCQLSHTLPLTMCDLSKQAQSWHTPLLFSLLDQEDPAGQLLTLLTCLLLEKSFIVVGRSFGPGSVAAKKDNKAVMNTEEITLISAVVNSLPYFLSPITWVQTHIAILPNELIDILDAPMPYLVGVRAKEIVSQLGVQDESLFLEYLTGIECMEDKCVVELNQINRLKIHNFAPEPASERAKFIQFDQDTYVQLNRLLKSFQETLKYKTVGQILQSSNIHNMHMASTAFLTNNVKENSNKIVYDPCFNPTEHQQSLCQQIIELIQKQIILEIVHPLEELSRVDNIFSVLNSKKDGDQKSKPVEQSQSYTMDEVRTFIRKNLTHKWVEGNASRSGSLQQKSGGTERNKHSGASGQPMNISRSVTESMDKFYLELTHTQMMAQTIEGKVKISSAW